MKNMTSTKGGYWILFLAGVFLAGLVGITMVQAEEGQAVIGVTLQVGGMHCEDCPTKVKQALEEAGASGVEVSMEKNEAVAQYDKSKTDPDKLVAAIKAAGFEASVKQ